MGILRPNSPSWYIRIVGLQRFGVRAWGLGFRVWGLQFGVYELGFTIWGACWGSGFGGKG